MNELKVRLLSGVIYVSLLLLSTLNPLLLWSILYVFGLICVFEFSKLINLKSNLSYIIFSLLFVGFILINFYSDFFFSKTLTDLFLIATIILCLILVIKLFSNKNTIIISNGLILNTFYLTGGFVFLSLISIYKKGFNPSIFLSCFILVWINDSFAYLVGKKFGKIKLLPQVSPKKTIEGFLGGIVFTCIGGVLIFHFTETLSLFLWIILSVVVSVIGTLGDLIESKFKRQAQVKDSGSIMPGHGGLLDRLDSIIFASPFIYLFLSISVYVS